MDLEALIEFIQCRRTSNNPTGAKNYKNVAVVVDPSDYYEVMQAIRKGEKSSLDQRFELAEKGICPHCCL